MYICVFNIYKDNIYIYIKQSQNTIAQEKYDHHSS